MNWRILKKCILMLTLGCGVHLTWLGWDIFVLLNPEYWQYVHLERVYTQITLNSSFLVILFLLIFPCYKFQGNQLIERYLPYMAVGTFVISLCRDAYLVGVISPVATTSYVCFNYGGTGAVPSHAGL